LNKFQFGCHFACSGWVLLACGPKTKTARFAGGF
jgi:hypothetical protein